MHWQPSASVESLRQRGQILNSIRHFFAQRGVMEVDTPIITNYPNADPYIHCLSTELTTHGRTRRHYLRSSPEHAMKRLLAAGSGSIYQVGKVFRDGEAGTWHNHEFTLLEWYRTELDHFGLMNELEALLAVLNPGFEAVRIPYRDAFVSWGGVDPWTASMSTLEVAASTFGGPRCGLSRNECLDVILTLAVQPQMHQRYPEHGVFLHGFPASQAALARLLPDCDDTAARFELYFHGVELANGYWELTDPNEQRTRFEAEGVRRIEAGEDALAIDELLLAALDAGLPTCAGVALGIERLHMVMHRKPHIRDVLTFPTESA